jgi:hypothetical protein
VAVVAATFASVGDLLLLSVAAMPRGTGSDVRLAWVLLAGHYLGVFAIPFYAAGYWAVSAAITRPGAARTWFGFGAVASALGAVIHGITGVVIAVARAGTAQAERAVPNAAFAGMAGADIVAAYAEFLLPLWITVAVAAVVASAAFTIAIASGASRYPRWLAIFSPAALVVYIASAGAFSAGAPLIVPAAPNLAHVVFFALIASLVPDDDRTVRTG